MQDLTIEQLKFARKIGAVYCLSDYQECTDGYFGKPGYVFRDGEWKEWEDGTDNAYTLRDTVAFTENRFTIDFSPLDALSTDNTEQPLECPVNEDFIWRKVCVDGYTHFTILPKEKDEWPESRQDAIGQNGNDGEHYEKPNKYQRMIKPGFYVDVYDVLKAWNVSNPALQHLIKKALQPGERGHKDLAEDLEDILASAKRAIELEEQFNR